MFPSTCLLFCSCVVYNLTDVVTNMSLYSLVVIPIAILMDRQLTTEQKTEREKTCHFGYFGWNPR